MNVSEVMTRHAACCEPFDTMERAARIMWEHDCGAVPVVDASGVVHGIVTDRDLAMSAYFKGRPLAAITVAEAMSRELHCCAATDPLERALGSMKEHQVHRMPVVDGEGRIAGVLSLADVLRAERAAQGKARQALAEAIVETLAVVRTPRVPAALPTPQEGTAAQAAAALAEVEVPAVAPQKPAAASQPAPPAKPLLAPPSPHVASTGSPSTPKGAGTKRKKGR